MDIILIMLLYAIIFFTLMVVASPVLAVLIAAIVLWRRWAKKAPEEKRRKVNRILLGCSGAVMVSFALLIGYLYWQSMDLNGELLSVGIRNVGSYTYEGTDTHGGFHGDGTSYYKLAFSETEKLESVLADMADQEETWHSLPMPGEISQLIHMPYGEEMDRTVHEQINGWIEKELPGLCDGYWYFKDRNTVDHSPSGAARNYTIAVYDLGTKQFYYYEYDS